MTIGADTQFLDQGIAKSRALAQSLKETRAVGRRGRGGNGRSPSVSVCGSRG